MNRFNAYSYGDFRWNGKYVAFSDSAKFHLEEYKLDAIEIIDMLHDDVPCPTTRRFRKTDIEICSKKNRQIFRITLFKDYCWDVGESCWCVKHVKPT